MDIQANTTYTITLTYVDAVNLVQAIRAAQSENGMSLDQEAFMNRLYNEINHAMGA